MIPDLIVAIESYLAAYNDKPKLLVWTATGNSILEKLAQGHDALQAVKEN